MGAVGYRYRKFRDLPPALSGPSKVKYGFPAGKADSDNIDKAFWNEFGTKGGASGGGWGGPIPERPFMRNSARSNRSKYRAQLKAAAAKILNGDLSLRVVLQRFGIMTQGDVQAEIVSLSSPPNAPVTIEMKGSSNPLIADGEMHQAVTWKIDDD